MSKAASQDAEHRGRGQLRRTVARIALGAIGAFAALSACSENTSPSDPNVVAAVGVTPDPTTLDALGATATLTATALNASQQAIPGKTFTWASSDPMVATVSSEGVVTAVSNGTATVSATTDGVSGPATVSIQQKAATVTITPGTPIVAAYGIFGATQLAVDADDSRGNNIDFFEATWQSDDEDVVRVGAAGIVTTVAPGSAAVIATVDGVSDTITVTSSPPGVPTSGLLAHYPFTGNADDASGNGLDGTVAGDADLQVDRFINAQASYSFGVDRHVDLGSVFDSQILPVTISAWVFPTAAKAKNPIFTSDDPTSSPGFYSGFWIEVVTGNFLVAGYGDGTSATASARRIIQTDTGVAAIGWTHVVATIRGPTDMTLYVDGAEVAGSYSGSGGNMSHDSRLAASIARNAVVTTDFWEGLVDDVRVYNRSLSALEVGQLFREGGWSPN